MNRNEKKAGVKILILDKIDFTIETIIKDQEGNYKQEEVTFANIYTAT